MATAEQHSIRSEPSEPASGGGQDSGEWRPGLDPHDRARLTQAQSDPFAIVEEIPTEKSSLGWFSVSCLIFNRMIGSGVFNSSSVIYSNTQSVGISIIIWLIGASTALSGVILYIELGLTVPRYRLGDSKEKIAVVRSGGELPYLNYFLKLPKFLATCVFGVSFIVFGNTAVNSIAFAVAVLQTAKHSDDALESKTSSPSQQTPAMVVGIAIAVNTFACLLHSVSRKWGIRLNNLLGTMKLAMVFLLIAFGFNSVREDNTTSERNFTDTFNTRDCPSGIYRYAEAVVFAIFPFGGFHQANYASPSSPVLAEIRHPRRNFAMVSGFSVLLICCLMMTINTLYAAVIPWETLRKPNHDQALEYFRHTITRFTSSDDQIRAVTGSFRALSAIGNVIVFTFTAARVKQEIAKEGVLPFSLFFASSYSFSFRHGFRRLPQTREGYQLHSSRAPAAALALHWTVTTLMIIGTVFSISWRSHFPAYYLILASYAYGLDIVWFSVIGIAMLCLRLWPGSRWRYKSPIPHTIGIIAALVFTVTNGFPLIAIWVIKDTAEPFLVKSEGQVPWFTSQTFVFSVLAAGGLYWFAFRFYVYQRKAKTGDELEITRVPIFWRDRSSAAGVEGGSGYGGELLLLYEIIKVRWRSYRRGEERESMVTEPMQFGGPDSDVRTSKIPLNPTVARMSGGRRIN
ncbi:amino acid permease-domain-containing protein [Cercophora newfieldiana]|uniref:Amino acid permease-domain-containing protein n=1 Tax=Cercophora newfieldiana TaxID=92897 RepID=A0AA40CZS2_9PEZI|nr:amino acid permease-domain-containing protein [Cercophora newfieldiana]